MNISVAMTTYNGSKYILDQLRSIYNQTVGIDELIICDDCSTDNTLDIVSRFLEDNKISNCKIIRNDSNIGWRSNFRKALRECTGDIIFLSDQDDIWESNKIEEMKNAMERNDKILILASNYNVFHDNSTEFYNCPKNVRQDDGTIRKLPFNEKGLHIERPGCVFCARRKLVNIMLENDNEKWAHDVVLWYYASIEDGLYILNRRLIRYRRHSQNATKRKSMILKITWADDINRMLFFKSYCHRNGKLACEQTISRILFHFRKRMYCVYRKKLFLLILHQIKYYKYYYSFKNLLSDECRILFNKH